MPPHIKLAEQDRSLVIRLASGLPAGGEARQVLLGMAKGASYLVRNQPVRDFRAQQRRKIRLLLAKYTFESLQEARKLTHAIPNLGSDGPFKVYGGTLQAVNMLELVSQAEDLKKAFYAAKAAQEGDWAEFNRLKDLGKRYKFPLEHIKNGFPKFWARFPEFEALRPSMLKSDVFYWGEQKAKYPALHP